MHPWEVDPGQPRLAASALSRFRHYRNLARTEKRLRQLLSDFRFDAIDAVFADGQPAANGQSIDEQAGTGHPGQGEGARS